MDKFNRADINAARWLGRNKEFDGAAKFTGYHHFLLVAARETAATVVDTGRAHIKGFDQLVGMFADGPLVDGQAAGKGRLIVGV